MVRYPSMLLGLHSVSRCRIFIVPLCALVFVLALYTRLPFKPEKASIKAFADDYDRLKAKETRVRSVIARVSLRPATHLIASLLLPARPDFDFHAVDAFREVVTPQVCFTGLLEAIRPPPPLQ
jgi:hypothetical protein